MRTPPRRLRPLLVATVLASCGSSARFVDAAPRQAPINAGTASDAWHGCHEMEEYGDATACWKLWLRRYRAVGGEAEVYVAEQRATATPVAAARPVPVAAVVAPAATPAGAASAHVAPEKPPTAAAVVVLTPKPDAPAAREDAAVPVAAPAPTEAAATVAAVEVSERPQTEASGSAEPAAPGEPTSAGASGATPEPPAAEPAGADPAAPPSQDSAHARRKHVGLSLTPGVAFGVVTYNYGSTFQGQSEYEMPAWVMGGGATVGYDLSEATGVRMLSVRAAGGFMSGVSGMQVEARVMPIDVTLEKGLTIVPKLAFFGDVGPTATVVSVRVPTDGQKPMVFNGAVFGAIVRAGFERELTDDLALRIDGFCRMNFSTASYSGGSGAVAEAFQRRSDHFATIGSTLSLSLTL